MKLTIWKTGHPIADTVADAFAAGEYHGEADLVYGILRHNVFKTSERWFNIDRGYFNPGHFDGYYRISYKGTQVKWHEGIPQVESGVKLEDWKSSLHYTGRKKRILICPPTDAVRGFFRLGNEWTDIDFNNENYIVRYKGDSALIDWSDVGGVITFNSSIGWEALRRGIPCVSDITHSIIGSYYSYELKKKNLDYNFDNIKAISREPLFNAMRAHQFTLAEIRNGKAKNLIEHYLNNADLGTAVLDVNLRNEV